MTKLTFNIIDADIEHFYSCIACGDRDFYLISNCRLTDGTGFLSTSICNQCGHVFRNTCPSKEWFSRNFKKRCQFQKGTSWSPINPAIEEQRYQRYLAIGSVLKDRFPMHESFLDVGCGPGTGFDALRKQGFKPEGIESDESRSEIAKENGYSVFEGDWENYRSQKKFDIISSIHSLEHFHNPSMFLDKFRYMVHAESILFIEVPEVLDHVQDWNDSLYLAHLSNFNENSLVTLAEKTGWSLVERIYPYSDTPLPKNHLTLLFKPSKNEKSSRKEASQVQDSLKVAILNAYKRNLPVQMDDLQPINFTVKEINDLSLTFKGCSDIKEVVHDNYLGRKLSRLNGNHFLVT